MDKIAVLIPCYNEEQTVEKVIRDAKNALPEAVVYVYDNNSTDRTAELAETAGAVVRHEYRQGKGNVIRRMFREIDAECYLMLDGDDTYPLDNARELVDQVLTRHADMVVGDRLSSTYFRENKRHFHNFGNSFMRWGINRLFHSDIRDIMTGYRAFSYEFVKTFPVFSQGFEIETEMTVHAVHNDGVRVIGKMLQLYRNYKPLKFFGGIGLILFIAAFVFLIPIVNVYMKTGLVPRFPTLIVCGFMALAGIQSFFAGMILEILEAKDRRDFEQRFLYAAAQKREKAG